MASCLNADACAGARGGDVEDSVTSTPSDKPQRVCSIANIFDSCAARDPGAASTSAAPGSGGFRIISADSPSAAAAPEAAPGGSSGPAAGGAVNGGEVAAPQPGPPSPASRAAAPLGSGTPPEKRNLVIALRREADRLMTLQHFESAEIVLTEALMHCADGGVYAMHAECLEKLERTQDAIGAWEAAAQVTTGEEAASASAKAAALRAKLVQGAADAAAA